MTSRFGAQATERMELPFPEVGICVASRVLPGGQYWELTWILRLGCPAGCCGDSSWQLEVRAGEGLSVP